MSMESIYLAIPLASLFGAIIAGFFGKQIGRTASHWVTIIGVGTSFVLSCLVLKDVAFDGAPIFNQALYTWMGSPFSPLVQRFLPMRPALQAINALAPSRIAAVER